MSVTQALMDRIGDLEPNADEFEVWVHLKADPGIGNGGAFPRSLITGKASEVTILGDLVLSIVVVEDDGVIQIVPENEVKRIELREADE